MLFALSAGKSSWEGELNGKVLYQKKEMVWERCFHLSVILQHQQEAATHWAAHWQTFRQTQWKLKLWQSPSLLSDRAEQFTWMTGAVCVCRMFSQVHLLQSSERYTWVPANWYKSISPSVGGSAVCAFPRSLTDYRTVEVFFITSQIKKGTQNWLCWSRVVLYISQGTNNPLW